MCKNPTKSARGTLRIQFIPYKYYKNQLDKKIPQSRRLACGTVSQRSIKITQTKKSAAIAARHVATDGMRPEFWTRGRFAADVRVIQLLLQAVQRLAIPIASGRTGGRRGAGGSRSICRASSAGRGGYAGGCALRERRWLMNTR